MRALITGINGFLGRYTATLLANQGYDVVGIWRDQSKRNAKIRNIKVI